MTFLKLYLLALVLFVLIDLFWLGILAKELYRSQIGHWMATDIRWGAALLFYLLYIGGLVYFAIWPGYGSKSALLALTQGAAFGLVCYATYDLTNLATLKSWPVKMVIYDLIWGTFISGATAGLTCWLGIWSKKWSS